MILSDRWLYFFSQQLECVRCRKKKRRYVFFFDGEKVNGKLFTIKDLNDKISTFDVWCEECTPQVNRRVTSAGRERSKEEAAKYANVRSSAHPLSAYDAEVLQNGLVLSKRALVKAVKQRPCAICGNSFPEPAQEFHHVRGEKVAEVSTMVKKPFSVEDLIQELEKCVVLCAVCHKLVHSREGIEAPDEPVRITHRILQNAMDFSLQEQKT